MKSNKKKVWTLADFLKKNSVKPSSLSNKEHYKLKYKHSISQAKASDSEEKTIDALKIKTGYYSLRTRIKKNPWISQRPATKATKWMYQEVFKNASKYKYTQNLMFSGGLFIFEYKNPKYKGTSVLPWFDKYPLVISLGPVSTNLGVRNLGFNLHLLPPKIRIIVLCTIFEMYKKMYRYQIFYKTTRPVTIRYQQIVRHLKRYGVKFAIRMYIPGRMRQVVRFPYTDWHKAIFIPSRGYDSIRAAQLIREWRKFCRDNGTIVNPNLDWRSVI